MRSSISAPSIEFDAAISFLSRDLTMATLWLGMVGHTRRIDG